MVLRELYLKRIRPFYHSEFVKILTGVRRCGKSTLLRQISEELIASGISSDKIIDINFENYAYNSLRNPDAFYRHVEDRIEDATGKTYLLFDEVQFVDGFERVVNSFRATHDVSMFLTGSNSKLLSGDLASELGGRTLSFRIMPFTFGEFCDFRGVQGAARASLFDEYLRWGGFPLVCAERDEAGKAVVLDNLYDSIVLKDVILRNKIASPHTLETVLNFVVSQSGSTLSGRTIAASLSDQNRKVSAPTVYDYLRAIESACIVGKATRYDVRGKKVLAFEEKLYVCDLGLFQQRKSPVAEDIGHALETLVFNELVARGFKVFVGKIDAMEIDFMISGPEGKAYVQVAYMLASEKTREREFGSLEAVRDNYPKYVVTLDPVTRNRNGIIHLGLIDFLLDEGLLVLG